MKRFIEQHWREFTIMLLLLIASAVASSFVVVRRVVTDTTRWQYYFLIWNLFLAWIPLGIAFLLRLMRRPPLPLLLVGGAVWFVFLPNAPYILTDLIHFRRSYEVLWLDWSMFLTFALTGLFAGYASLVWMQAIVRERWGGIVANGFTLLSLVGCGVGVYIGRFLRWNSWDIVTRPDELARNIYAQFFSPETFFHTWALSMIFAGLFAFCYVMVRLLSAETTDVHPPTRLASGD